jgi:hypothetical protein
MAQFESNKKNGQITSSLEISDSDNETEFIFQFEYGRWMIESKNS